MAACTGNTAAQGTGPLARLYRRVVATGKPPGPWQNLGTTCFPNAVPGAKAVLGLADIVAAFHKTPWAKPNVHIQPEGNLTLVTLPTYFQVTWPEAGYQPGEVDTVSLLGYQVRIRPTLQGYIYYFGDGTKLGPTKSPGGPYPSGDMTRAYPAAGTYGTHVAITYGGEFSVNGGEWITIPDTVTVDGPTQSLKVTTAKNRLVAH